ncbi:MAG: TRAP transporter substrate-binding protein [Syntrophorhabdales bacterium]|jgi:TRAP-type C4-dicarboxylate transport system substrate-binding protein
MKRFMREAVLLVFVVSACFIASISFAQDKVMTLNFSNFWPAPHKMSQLAEEWAKEVEKRTNGKVKVTVFHGATLTPPGQTYDSVVNGICDIGMSALAYTRGKFPLSEVIDLPLGYRSGVAATNLVNEYYKKFKPREFDAVKVLFFHAHSPGLLFTRKPVASLEDMKGMKIRSTGLSNKVVEALGGVPVGMPMTESYDALSKGVADGITCPYEAMWGFKLGEVLHSCTEDYAIAHSTAFFVVINKNKWARMSPSTGTTIEKINEEFIVKYGKAWDEIDIEGKAFMIKKGATIIKLSKAEEARWKTAVKPILDEYVETMKAKNLPGDEALKFCLDYLKTH